jgi:hypothetical protein
MARAWLALLVAVALPAAASEAPVAGGEVAAAGGPGEAPGGAAASPRSIVRVQLKGGQELHGWIVERSADALVLELAAGGRVTLAAGALVAVVAEPTAEVHQGEIWYADPNRTRYLHSPSAMMLRAGEGYFSQSELLASTVALGVTDHVTVLGGAFVPLWFADDGFNLVAALKVGASLTPALHVAIGAETLVLPGTSTSVGLGFAGVTVGGPNAHLTLAGGPPFKLGRGGDEVGPLILALSGNVRVGRRTALVTENWFVTQPRGGVDAVDAFALRIVGVQGSVDIGLIRFPRANVPVPWLDFTWHFDVGKPRGASF